MRCPLAIAVFVASLSITGIWVIVIAVEMHSIGVAVVGGVIGKQ